ncbi:MAG: hypothetical protein Homavirus49_4 [Homavirus sp.]|uniref:Uncharacterized protein n=1 Tax=Homavirus sp. TaxID=2487769 RepID=A0A3G5A9A8_9VIRU|nr:MAG: hypothetical protein Homavirus49_4 [Homavirus sp.]
MPKMEQLVGCDVRANVAGAAWSWVLAVTLTASVIKNIPSYTFQPLQTLIKISFNVLKNPYLYITKQTKTYTNINFI